MKPISMTSDFSKGNREEKWLVPKKNALQSHGLIELPNALIKLKTRNLYEMRSLKLNLIQACLR